MLIPSEVKIGGIVYAVKVQDDWQGRDGDDGETRYDVIHGNTLYIGADLSQEAKETTFFHECLHAMNSTMDHCFLDSLSEQLYQLLKDNRLLAE